MFYLFIIRQLHRHSSAANNNAIWPSILVSHQLLFNRWKNGSCARMRACRFTPIYRVHAFTSSAIWQCYILHQRLLHRRNWRFCCFLGPWFFSEAVHRFFQAKICLLNLLISHHHHHHQCTPRWFTGFLSGVAAPELWQSEGLLPSFDGDVLIHINSKLISEGAKMSSLVRAFKCLDISLSYLVVAF